MRKNKKRKSNLKRLIALIPLFFLLLILFNFYNAYIEIRKMDREIADLNTEIEKIEDKNEELSKKVKHINSDDFIEKIAREELGLVKEGELLYIIVNN